MFTAENADKTALIQFTAVFFMPEQKKRVKILLRFVKFPFFLSCPLFFMNILRLIEQLKLDEGFESRPYQDSLGFWTIGHGTTWTLDKNGNKQKIDGLTKQWTKETAEYHLYAHISQAIRQAKSFVNNFAKLCDEQQEALVNMAYQLGTKQNQFKKARQAIQKGQNDKAYRELINSRWATQTRKRAYRIATTFLNHEIRT